MLSLLVGAMLVLLPVLALLQYRWLGQLSDAERERLQRSLRAATADFTQHVDLEVARAIVGLHLDAGTVRDQAWDRYAEKYAAWRAISDTSLVSDVLLVDAPGRREAGADSLRLRRWNRETKTFEPAGWPSGLDDVRARLAADYRTFVEHPEPPFFRPADLLTTNGSTLLLPVAAIAPLPPSGVPTQYLPVFGYTLVRLNLGVLERQVVPAAVARHFGPPGATDYHLAIVTRGTPSRVVYESVPGDADALRTHADVDEPFFGMRPDNYGLMRQAVTALRANEARGTERDRADHGDRRSVFFSVFNRRNAEAGPPRPGADDGARWRLLVRHRAGSLEAAVAAARQRNLALSFGILVLMAVSIGLIVVAARRAQHLAKQQIEFVASVSHELRTPVAVIGAAADNLSKGVISEPARVKQYGAAIQGEARRLGETVERVLQFAGIQAGHVAGHRVAVDPVAMIEETLAASQALVAEAGATVETSWAPDLPPVLADPAALRAALQNLVANAVKYGGTGRWVRVSAKAVSARRGRELEIVVEDHGLGIAASDLPHIFEPFYRGIDAVTRQIHGNGLGLSIVKSVVDAHGGRVSVTSTPGAGSTFTIRLPGHRADAVEEAPSAARVAGIERAHGRG